MKTTKKLTIKEIVSQNKDRAMACGTPKELYQLGVELGFNSRAAFPRYKAALLEVCGIDYDQVRETRNEQRAIALAESVSHEVTLYSDAKARCERFAICGADKKVIWFGRFFDDEGSEQSAAELEAAKKAIWLASKIREAVKGNAIRLNLIVDAQWLTTLSGKAAILAEQARKFNIELNISWIPGAENPADSWTTASGYKKWGDNDLAALAESTREMTVSEKQIAEVAARQAAERKEFVEAKRREEAAATEIRREQNAHRDWIENEMRKQGELPPLVAVADDDDDYGWEDDY